MDESSEEGEEEDGGDMFDRLLRPDVGIGGRALIRSVEEESGTEDDSEDEDEESEDEDENTELSESSEEDYDSDSESEEDSEEDSETDSETDELSGSEGVSEEDPERIHSSTRPPHDTTNNDT